MLGNNYIRELVWFVPETSDPGTLFNWWGPQLAREDASFCLFRY